MSKNIEELFVEEISKGMTEEESALFYADIPDTIGPDDMDLSLVHWQFMRDTLKRLPKITPEIQTVIDGISLLAEGKKWSEDEANAAAREADVLYAAAEAAAYAGAKAALWSQLLADAKASDAS